ncbi:MAG: hypothetical protein QOI25_4455 [Mycobacterium sp.]|nr:hypothetical protein [Mycobacterium sp.]
MSLVAGRGPLSADPAGWFSPALPDDVVFVEPHPRRVVAQVNGRTVIDTEHALLVHRRGHALSYAFEADGVGDLQHGPVAEAPGYVHVPWDLRRRNPEHVHDGQHRYPRNTLRRSRSHPRRSGRRRP